MLKHCAGYTKINTQMGGFLILLIVMVLAMKSGPAQIPLSPQPEKAQTRSGNNQYQKKNYSEAEASYKKALDIKNNMPEATFNLGDAVYEQKRYEDARKQFQLSAQTNADPQVKAKAYHNLGNTFLQEKKWEEAIKAYKNALKLNPGDVDTKYNLAYANAMMQRNQGSGENNQNQEDKQEQKDQEEQKQDEQKKEEQNKEQNQDQKQDDKEGKEDQQPQQGEQPRLSKEEAEQLLSALESEEQKTNQKMQKKQMKGVKVKVLKDW